MFTDFEKNIISCGYFDILEWNNDSVVLMSTEIKHTWIIKKFNKKGYPGVVLYHSHDGENYHVHFCFKDQDSMPAVSEIMEHDRYQKKKLKLRNKITKVSNYELLKAIG